jgi:CRP/FNR family transcriptional regulator, cyclic AMP receptor protein
MKDIEAALRGVEIFARLNRRQLARLAKLATRREFPAGAPILRAGDSGVALYVVVSGRVRITLRSGETGMEWLLREMGPGEAFGEIALIDGGPRAADVTAAEPTECVLISRWDFSGEIRNDPDIARALLPVLCAKIRRLQDQLTRYEVEAGPSERESPRSAPT